MAKASALDLTNPDDVLRYLADTPFASSKAETLSGGNANYIFRLHLKAPYEGRETLVMKHGKGALKINESFLLDIERQNFEARALQSVNAVLSPDALARVPALHLHDKAAHVLIMDDCGATAHNLKQLIKDGRLDLDACRTIGRALGIFLATIHRECTKDRSLLDFLDKNMQMKHLSALVTYGRLVGTLTGERQGRDGKAVVDPPLVESLPAGTVQTISEIAQETSPLIEGANADNVFTMGDFWTGNIVVNTHTDTAGALKVERIFVIDWEVTKPGLPYLDFGQFVAEMHTLRLFHEDTAKNLVDGALEEFYAAYKEGYPVDEKYVRGATAHLGAHLVAWTPVVGWEPREVVRKAVLEGVEYLVSSKEDSLEILKKKGIISLLD